MNDQTQTTTAPSKPWWKSKTIWFNALATIASGVDVLAQNLPVLQGVLPPGTGSALAVAVPVVNVVLRSVTSQGIHAGGDQGQDNNRTPPPPAVPA